MSIYLQSNVFMAPSISFLKIDHAILVEAKVIIHTNRGLVPRQAFYQLAARFYCRLMQEWDRAASSHSQSALLLHPSRVH